MEIIKKDKKSLWILVVLVIAFVGCFLILGPDISSDSHQYVDMHIHREPMYPLFLALLRLVFGEYWLTAMGILQNLFLTFSIWYFAEYIAQKFELRFWEKLIVLALELMPHIVTPLVAETNVVLANAVMSEGISMPLFTLFVVACLEMLTQTEPQKAKKAALIALGLAFVLALTRGQMMSNILVWMVALCVKLILQKNSLKKKLVQLGIVFLMVAATFAVRSVCVKTYIYAVHGHYIGNTNGTVHMLANILYASDREDGENIEDDAAREMFYYVYDMAEEYGANYKYAGETLTEKVAHLEKWHNTINFEMLEAPMRQYFKENVSDDYIIQDIYSDEMAGQIIAGILPKCLGQWFINYLLLACYGLVRSIAVVHPLINWIAGGLYVFAVILTGYAVRQSWKKEKKIDSIGWFMGLTLLCILANAFSVSLIIMPISRYMIYNFPMFYTALGVLLLMLFRKKKHNKR